MDETCGNDDAGFIHFLLDEETNLQYDILQTR